MWCIGMHRSVSKRRYSSIRAWLILARHKRRITAQPPIPGATARLFSPSNRSFATSTGWAILEIHLRCRGRPVGAASAKRWIGGWRSIHCRSSRKRSRASMPCYANSRNKRSRQEPGRGCASEEVHLPRAGYCLGAAARPQLAVEVVDVGLDVTNADKQLGGDPTVTLAGGYELEDFQLPFTQRLG